LICGQSFGFVQGSVELVGNPTGVIPSNPHERHIHNHNPALSTYALRTIRQLVKLASRCHSSFFEDHMRPAFSVAHRPLELAYSIAKSKTASFLADYLPWSCNVDVVP